MHRWSWICLASLAVVLAGCAAGPGSDWAKEGAGPAGFWAGLWHGALLVVALIVSFFTDDVSIYEVNNGGTAYNIAFVLGVLAVYGSGTSITVTRKRKAKAAEGFEARIKDKVERWVDEEDWDELGDKIERKIKDKLRRWLAEDDDAPKG